MLEGVESCTLVLGRVICLVGDMMVVVAIVVNTVCSTCWSTVSEEATFPSVGDTSADVLFCGTSLQMTSEVLVP